MKNTLTIPKVKDLVTSPSKKYDNIYALLLDKQTINDNISQDQLYTEIDLLPNNMENSNSNSNSMKDELKKFLKTNLNNSEIQDYNDSSSNSGSIASFSSEKFSYI
jgi:hypothetical protein